MSDKGKSNPESTPVYLLTASLLIATLSIIASVSGLLCPDDLYPTETLREFALANDAANLFIGLPILLGSIWLDHRGKYVGCLLWPGALMYTLYNYLAYVIAVPLSWIYITYLLIVALSFYTLIAVLGTIDFDLAEQRLSRAVPERLSGAVLFILGAFVFVRVFGVVIQAQMAASMLEPTDLALLLADTLLAPAWVIGGILLWKNKPLGYATGLALLFQGSMLFLGLIIVLALQPLFNDASLPLADIIIVAAMGLICFIPFFGYLRGASSSYSRMGR
jgi:hypothetical protein